MNEATDRCSLEHSALDLLHIRWIWRNLGRDSATCTGLPERGAVALLRSLPAGHVVPQRGPTTVREKDTYWVVHRPMGPAARLVCPVLPWVHGRYLAVSSRSFGTISIILWGNADGVATKPPVASGSNGSKIRVGDDRP